MSKPCSGGQGDTVGAGLAPGAVQARRVAAMNAEHGVRPTGEHVTAVRNGPGTEGFDAVRPLGLATHLDELVGRLSGPGLPGIFASCAGAHPWRPFENRRPGISRRT